MCARFGAVVGLRWICSLLAPEYTHSIVFVSSDVGHVSVDRVSLPLVKPCDALSLRELVADLGTRFPIGSPPGYTQRAL